MGYPTLHKAGVADRLGHIDGPRWMSCRLTLDAVGDARMICLPEQLLF